MLWCFFRTQCKKERRKEGALPESSSWPKSSSWEAAEIQPAGSYHQCWNWWNKMQQSPPGSRNTEELKAQWTSQLSIPKLIPRLLVNAPKFSLFPQSRHNAVLFLSRACAFQRGSFDSICLSPATHNAAGKQRGWSGGCLSGKEAAVTELTGFWRCSMLSIWIPSSLPNSDPLPPVPLIKFLVY